MSYYWWAGLFISAGASVCITSYLQFSTNASLVSAFLIGISARIVVDRLEN